MPRFDTERWQSIARQPGTSGCPTPGAAATASGRESCPLPGASVGLHPMAGIGRGINGTHVASPRIKIMNTSPKQLLRLALAAALLTLLGAGCRTVSTVSVIIRARLRLSAAPRSAKRSRTKAYAVMSAHNADTGGTFAGVAGIYNRHRYADEMRVALAHWARRISRLTT